MAHYPVLPTGTQPRHPAPTIKLSPAVPPALDTHHRLLFAQRLAVLIKRIRAATKEGNSNER